MIRKALIAAAATVALASPAVADGPGWTPAAAGTGGGYNYAGASGYLGATGGGIIAYGPAGAAYFAGQVNGAVNLPIGAMNIQLEARNLLIMTTPDLTAILAAIVHAYWRSPRMAIGVFGGPEPLVASGSGIVVHFGAEAQFYFARMSLYAQAAYVAIISTSGGGTDPGWYARFSSRFFPAENVLIEAGIRYLGLGASGNAWTFFGTGEVQLSNSPLSLIATVRHLIVPGGGGTAATTVQAGFRINFGGPLSAQGAPMDTLPILY